AASSGRAAVVGILRARACGARGGGLRRGLRARARLIGPPAQDIAAAVHDRAQDPGGRCRAESQSGSGEPRARGPPGARILAAQWRARPRSAEKNKKPMLRARLRVAPQTLDRRGISRRPRAYAAAAR